MASHAVLLQNGLNLAVIAGLTSRE
jgi:hypothetical protein